MAASATAPRRVPSRRGFIRGGIGAIITCLGSFPMMIAIFLYLASTSRYSSGMYSLIVGGSIVLLVGCVIEGRGFNGFYKNYRLSMGKVAEIFSIIAPIALAITAYVGMEARYYSSYSYSYTRYNNELLFWGGLALFAVMAILWGATCLQAKKSMRRSGSLSAAGILYIIAGAFIASFLLAPIGFILLFVSGIITSVVFLGYGQVDLVFSYIISHGGTIDKPKCAEDLGTTVEVVDAAINVLIKDRKIEK